MKHKCYMCSIKAISSMGRLPIKIPDELEAKFRREIGKRFPEKKGNLRKALIEAIELWMEQAKAEGNKRAFRTNENPKDEEGETE